MKIQEIRKKSHEELLKTVAELRSTVRELRFRIANKEIKNHQQLRQVRKDIAKILTELNAKGTTS